MISSERIKNALKRPAKYAELVREGKKYGLTSAFLTDFIRFPFYFIPHDGVRVMEHNWDYLIVLDACRYDFFKELNEIEGRLERKTSLGSYTAEWGNKNFSGYYDDVVYVSANPRVCKGMINEFKGAKHFHDVVDAWDLDWSDDLNTVPPNRLSERAIKVNEEYPQKKLIIHYIQPHSPYIGETKFIPESPEELYRVKFFENDFFVRAYKDNLKLVLKEVKKLVEELEGKKIITSYHGKAVGIEPFQHPHHVHIKKLVEVPWLIVENRGS